MNTGKSILRMTGSLAIAVLILSCVLNQEVVKDKNIRCYNNIENAPPIDKYRFEVALQVQKNWEFPNNSQCAEDLRTSIILTILPDGGIKEIFVHKKSICKDLDDSAYAAIERAAPFKPFPKELKAKDVVLGLRFFSGGIW